MLVGEKMVAILGSNLRQMMYTLLGTITFLSTLSQWWYSPLTPFGGRFVCSGGCVFFCDLFPGKNLSNLELKTWDVDEDEGPTCKRKGPLYQKHTMWWSEVSSQAICLKMMTYQTLFGKRKSEHILPQTHWKPSKERWGPDLGLTGSSFWEETMWD